MNSVRAILGLFLLLLLQLILGVAEGQSPAVFKHLTVEDGLSSGAVLSIAQDNKGFIWAGTMDGLNRYDGRKVKVFKSFYRDNFIGASIKITQLCADQYDNLWIGTNNGLYVYNILQDSFRVYYHSATDKNSLCHNEIKALYVDRRKNLWVGTRSGINIITSQGKFEFKCASIPLETKDSSLLDVNEILESASGQMLAGTANGLISISQLNASSNWQITNHILPGNLVLAIAEDQYQNVWVGTNTDGLFRISHNDGSISHLTQSKNIEAGPISNSIRKIILDRKGKLWIGTLRGLNIVDPDLLKFQAFVNDPQDERTLNFNSIYDIMQDRQGSVWVSTYFGGLNISEAISAPFKTYQSEAAKNTIASNVVRPIIDDDSGNLWIGTEAEGLNFFDRKTNHFKNFRHDETNPASLSSNLVKALIRDSQNNLWVGIHGGGINILTPSGKKIKEFNSSIKGGALNSNDVIALLDDGKNHVWVGTEEDGVNIIDLASNRPEKFEDIFPNRRLTSKAITCLFRDSKNNIWVGTRQGLSRLQADGNDLTGYMRSNVPDRLLSDYINCITEDSRQKLWIGTYEGLTLFDPDKKIFATYTTSDGLAGNKVTGILSDDHDNLWISTNNGLSVLDSTRKKWHNFTVEDGLPSNTFNYGSYFRDKNGHMFFGTFKGLVEFVPPDIQINNTIPNVVLTGLAVNGKLISKSDSSKILSVNILETKGIQLKYDQNALTVDYAVLNFIKSRKNRSAYKLEGYDSDWHFTSNHSATFNGLQPGHYRLLIKASNNDGIWTTSPVVLAITILPPPWKTWWAYLLYVLFVLALIFGIIFFFVSRTAMRRKIHYEHMVNIKQQELHKMKMDFFTHISHEIRTPLTMIIGPVDVLINTLPASPGPKKMLNSIKSSAERLLKLTNDLLDFRKADLGYTQLQMKPVNIVAFTRYVFDKFKEGATNKNIHFKFESHEKDIQTYIDTHYMEIVLSNLFSNAMKFTSDKGNISASIIRGQNEIVEIHVCDDGVGIPKESQSKIFSNFYQADAGPVKSVGSGIGLAFSKSLVELHKGSLTFTSEINKATDKQETRFIITLLLEKSSIDNVR